MIIFHYLDITFLLNIGSSTAYCGRQNMEDMEIDQIVDVPDTPDRLTTRHVGRKYVGNPDVFVNEKRERGFPVAENGKDRRLGFCPPKNFNGGEMNNCSSHIAVSPSKKSYAPQNAPIFRRTQTDKYFSHDSIHTNGSEKMEKGKAICTKFPSKSMSRGGVAVFDLTEGNGQPQKLEPVFSHHGSKDSASEYKKELKVSVGNSPIPCIHASSNTSSNTFAGKCKIDDTILPCSNISVDRGKSIDLSSDSQQKTEKQTSLPPRFLSAPRFSGQKRLVRNGCISPLNIAARAKQATEHSSQRTSDVEQSHAGDAVSIATGSPVSINDIVAEERGSSRVKGKELLTHSSSSSAHDAGTINKVSRSPVIDYEEANDTNNVIRNSIKCSGGPGGWRTTRNHRINVHSSHDVTGHRLRRNNDAENFISTQYRNRVDRRDTGSSQSSREVRYPLEDHAADAISLISPEADQSTAPCPPADKLTKRQRKNGSTSSNPNSEIMFLDLLGESSNPSSSRTSVLDTEVVELSPETRYTNRVSHDLDDMPNDDSDALARQVEADEILARELQEQLYHEDSFDRVEIDEHLAWELQHEEELLHTSIDSHQTSNPRWLSRAPSNRQPRSRPHQSPTNRRRAVPHVPPSNRVSQLRNRIISRSPTPNISTRGRRLRFPVDMDFDMRLDILEALEDAVGDLSDMGVADDIFQAHRDFNENDYEMLLALDENNHQHAGASANQINCLPQSTVQTDNFEEACAICLETPVMGDTIRHLPCLHKFHKDCIDPWLHRRTSCPVCKSSIT